MRAIKDPHCLESLVRPGGQVEVNQANGQGGERCGGGRRMPWAEGTACTEPVAARSWPPVRGEKACLNEEEKGGNMIQGEA